MSGVKSPLKWHGGKSYLAKRIIDLLPPRDTWHLWREPYFGGGSVTLALDPEGISEAVNDVDGELVNFWRVISSEVDFAKFKRIIDAMPFSGDIFEDELIFLEVVRRNPDLESDSRFENYRRAVSFFIACRQSRQGLMRDFATPTRRLRRGMNENVSAWLSAIEGLPEVHERLKRIEIRNLDAVEFIKKYDDPRAVFMCDPPYVKSTRRTGGGEYRYEMTDGQHLDLLEVLSQIKGQFVLCGYVNPMYEEFERKAQWNRHDIKIDNKASGNSVKPRVVESLWMNY